MECPPLGNDPQCDHLVLYQNSRGRRIRLYARMGLIIALGVLVSVGMKAGSLGGASAVDAPGSLLSFAVGLLIAAFALIFGRSAWNLGNHFVVHFEVWPKSHLAIVRRAGWWKEKTDLVQWSDIRTANISEPNLDSPLDPLVRVHLRSGAKLIFDHGAGTAPQSWAALNRFLEKCSLPGAPEESYPFGETTPNLPPVASVPFGS